MLFRIIDNEAEARLYWEKLVTPNSVFDDWGFRYCFYKYFNYPLYFKVGFEGEQAVGLLALQKNTDQNSLEFFGGGFMEDNRVYAGELSDTQKASFFEDLPGVLNLEYIAENNNPNFQVLDQKYFLSLDGLENSEDYLVKYFESESRGKLKRKLKKIEQEKVEVILNNQPDMEKLIEFNIEKFNESATFNLPHRKEIFRDILKLPLDIFLNSFYLNGELQAVSLAILHQKNLAFVNFGVSNSSFKNFTSFVNMYNIDLAFEKGAKIFDAFCGDCGWKELWHLEKKPVYSFH